MTIEDNGFTVVRGFYDVKNHTKNVPDLFAYTKSLVRLGKTNTDEQTPGCPALAEDLEMWKVQIKVLSKMESITGKKLYPTYNYFRIYNQGSILSPHTDRPACEYSVTLNLGYTGDYNWSIWIQGVDKKNYEVKLEPGDALVYKGCQRPHWREPADERVICQSQVFMHYVDQDGPKEQCILDRIRPQDDPKDRGMEFEDIEI